MRRNRGDRRSSATRFTKADLIPLLLWTKLSEDDRVRLKAMNVQESFMIYIKAAFLFGAIVSSPGRFSSFLWNFVAAGLYPHEKHYVHTFLPISLGLFICGAALAFTAVFPPVLGFFFSITKSMGQELEPRISEWLGFVLLLPLGFGISFQLPLVMLFLERIHIFYGRDVPGEVADRGAADGHHVDGPFARRRSLQHDDDAGAADRAVLRRHWAVQMAAGHSGANERGDARRHGLNPAQVRVELRTRGDKRRGPRRGVRSPRRRVRRCECECNRPSAGRRSCRRRFRRSCRCGRP